MKPLYEYSVGQLYHPGRTSWPEGVDYNYREGAHELRLFFAAPQSKEIENVRTGIAEFAFVAEREALFLLFRFGGEESGFPWSDASYNWWVNPPDLRTLPNPNPTAEERALLSIFLIDAATGILQAQRVVTFSPEFTAGLHTAIRKQSRTAWTGQADYDKSLARLYRRYPDSEAMLASAQVRCKGGD